MKEKKWKDCPMCGSKGSMKHKTGLTETYKLKGYAPIEIGLLDGYFCDVCSEGFYSIKSEKLINSGLADKKAQQDSQRIFASELLEVDATSKILSVSRQRIHQMMKEGKIEYVYLGRLRFPLKRSIQQAKVAIKRIKK